MAPIYTINYGDKNYCCLGVTRIVLGCVVLLSQTEITIDVPIRNTELPDVLTSHIVICERNDRTHISTSSKPELVVHELMR
jgi:hypothetical protein